MENMRLFQFAKKRNIIEIIAIKKAYFNKKCMLFNVIFYMLNELSKNLEKYVIFTKDNNIFSPRMFKT